MQKENNHYYQVFFSEEFSNCLDKIQVFFDNQGSETLIWWYEREDKLIEYLELTISRYPHIGLLVESGPFKGLRRIVYGKGSHIMLNYLIYYEVREDTKTVNVINILPARSKGERIK